MVLFRWMLVAPAAAAGFVMSLLLASYASRLWDEETFVVCFLAAVAPVLVVGCAGLVAPARRTAVVWAVYALGLCAAKYLTQEVPGFVFGISAATGAWTAMALPRAAGEEVDPRKLEEAGRVLRS